MVTFEQLASEVADLIVPDCIEADCDSFKEMCQLYWWETSDIKEYIDGIISDLYEDTYLDEIDGDVILQGELMGYRNFMILVRRQLKQRGF